MIAKAMAAVVWNDHRPRHHAACPHPSSNPLNDACAAQMVDPIDIGICRRCLIIKHRQVSKLNRALRQRVRPNSIGPDCLPYSNWRVATSDDHSIASLAHEQIQRVLQLPGIVPACCDAQLTDATILLIEKLFVGVFVELEDGRQFFVWVLRKIKEFNIQTLMGVLSPNTDRREPMNQSVKRIGNG